MNLSVLKHYRIVRLIGQGGMGEVYLAEDTKLGRRVALKVLPERLAGDQDDRERFEREARAIAALNHPNIVTIHSVEEADGIHFLTMELVEGRPLGELIPRQGFQLDQFLKIAIPLSDAVAAAHQKGVVHRDLKPANVMITGDGRVKVLDFGLAKLRETAEAPRTDLTTRQITGEGRIVGTVSYMSPEQAEGKPVDDRSDVFSLGVVLYEMATGSRPFTGDTSVSVISSVLRDTPKLVTDLNHALPRSLARVIRTCLQKDPERRYQSAKDVRNELQTLKEELDSGELASAGDAAAPPRRRSGSAIVIWTAAAIVVAAAGYALVRSWRPVPTAALPSATFTQLTDASGQEIDASISPDGKWIVYSSLALGNWDVFLQAVGGHTPINLTKDSPAADTQPAFSPDGERIVFRSERDGGGIFLMGTTGEAKGRLTNFGFSPAFSPTGDAVVFASRTTSNPADGPGASELWIVQINTRETRRLLERDGLQPRWSPNGRFVAYWGLDLTVNYRNLWIVPVDGGAPVKITDDAPVDWSPAWSPDGRWLYFVSDRGGSMGVWRVGIDPDTGRRTGAPEPVTTPAAFVSGLSFSADGRRLVYANVIRLSNSYRVGFDPAAGAVLGQPSAVTTGSKVWAYQDLSPDGQWLVLASAGREDLFVCRSDGSGLRALTDDDFYDRDPRWSPDGQRIAFHSNRSGRYQIWSLARDGTDLRPLTEADADQPVRPVWSPDGTRVLYTDFSKRTTTVFDPRKRWRDQTLEVLPQLPGPPVLYVPTSWSPDGRRLAGQAATGLFVFDLIRRQYEKVSDEASSGGAAWLRDGRLLSGSANRFILIDPATRRAKDVLAADPSERLGLPRLPTDNRALFYLKLSIESDIWMRQFGGS